ncbi:hypothetical protein [Nocardiopsis deserti]|uniref:hypothetical protein n=1 Tax=Nocardiopsis deserti TaxID=2605988 RepID=UPI00123C52ED|nr:hypothetical protein [Nocardiopsis deserti]
MPALSEPHAPRHPYRNLVLLSLLTLSGGRPAHGLLEHAHRPVTGALPRGRRHPRPHAYPRVRRRVLRRSLSPRGWHLRGGAAGLCLSPVDGAGGEARLLEGLDGLDARARAAYGLLRVEGRSAGEAAALLSSVGVHDASGAVERALGAGDEHRFPDPAVVRVSGRGPHEVLDADSGFGLWGLAACAGEAPAEPVRTATAWEFARQELPGGGTGRWVCVCYGAHDSDDLARTVLVTDTDGGTDTVVAGERAGGWECSNLDRQVAAGTWWQAEDGRWHYLAAASREADRISAEGGASGSTEGGEALSVEGPEGGEPPAEEVGLVAMDVRGEEMTVFAR